MELFFGRFHRIGIVATLIFLNDGRDSTFLFLPISSSSFFQQILECFLVSGTPDLTQSCLQPGASERKGSATRNQDLHQRNKYTLELPLIGSWKSHCEAWQGISATSNQVGVLSSTCVHQPGAEDNQGERADQPKSGN